jgi:plastocyanin
LTDLTEISPSRPQEPTASPETPSRPSVSPDANAVIPSPGLPPSAGASPSPSVPAGSSPAPAETTIELTAANIKFDKSTITVPAGKPVIISFTNQDAGIPHNFAVYTDSSASQSIFTGEIITGKASTTYTFTAPTARGTYFFRCDVHPTLMTGQFIVQ